jgi:hypothetical protein
MPGGHPYPPHRVAAALSIIHIMRMEPVDKFYLHIGVAYLGRVALVFRSATPRSVWGCIYYLDR